MKVRNTILIAAVVLGGAIATQSDAAQFQANLSCSMNSSNEGGLVAVVTNHGGLPVPKGVTVALETQSGWLTQSYAYKLPAALKPGASLIRVVAGPATRCRADAKWASAIDLRPYNGAGLKAQRPQ